LISERRADGLVLCNPHLKKKQADELQALGVPFIVNGMSPNSPPVHAVEYDDFRGAYEATKHLIEHGYERIGTLTGDMTLRSAHERFRGFKQALEDYGRKFDPRLVAHGDYVAESSLASFVAHFRNIEWPEAMFIASDVMALEVMNFTAYHPDSNKRRIAITSFDNVLAAKYAGLSSMSGPLQVLGRRCAVILLELIQAKQQGLVRPPRIESVPVSLVVRRSCGCSGS
jgi:LacI family transcriptional regulator, galactose operon repressor